MDWRKIASDLLSRANHAGTTKEEAEACQEKATYIMAKYGIDEAMLRQKGNSTEKPIYRVFKRFAPYANQKVSMLAIVTNVLGGKIVEVGLDLYVFAYAADLERIQMLYFSLIAQMHIESAEVEVPQSVSKRAYTDSWLKGYVFGAGERLIRAYEKATGNGKELVLARDRQVTDALKEKFSNIKEKSTITAHSDSGAFASGVTSGLRADVGQDRLGKDAGRIAIDSPVKGMYS